MSPQISNFTSTLIGTLFISSATVMAYLIFVSEFKDSTSSKLDMGALSGGQRQLEQDLVLSWEVDSAARLFRVRVHNPTDHTTATHINLDELEAIIDVTNKDSVVFEFATGWYYSRLLTSFWTNPRVQIASKQAVDWSVPFEEFVHLQYDSDLTLDKAISSGTAQVKSIRH